MFHRHATRDELERQAERLKNRDWVEMLRVVHPSQADAAEREYLVQRLRADWEQLVGKLMATHSIVASVGGRNILVLCDHNTFANEISLIALPLAKKITERYGISVKITARASQRIDWEKARSEAAAENTGTGTAQAVANKMENPLLDELIDLLEKQSP